MVLMHFAYSFSCEKLLGWNLFFLQGHLLPSSSSLTASKWSSSILPPSTSWLFPVGGGVFTGRLVAVVVSLGGSFQLVPVPVVHFRFWVILHVSGRAVLAGFVARDWGDFYVLYLPGCIVYCWSRVLDGGHVRCLCWGIDHHPRMISASTALTFKYVLPCILFFMPVLC